MSKATENLEAAQKRALAIRPRVGGFPYLAETLRRAGVTRNFWSPPACQSLFLTNDGPVVTQGTPLATGTMDVPYDVDFLARTVAYYGCNGEEYVEAYPVVEVDS
jgi:uncharacterized protein YbcV (DUF1398 family)